MTKILKTEATETAAELVRNTAERTATALNIAYIQKDIVDIKQVLKDMSVRDEMYIRKSELNIDDFAKKEDLVFWRNLLVSGILVSLTIGVVLNLIRR